MFYMHNLNVLVFFCFCYP